jgi:hypothetical protein
VAGQGMKISGLMLNDNDDDVDDECMYARKVVGATLQSKGNFGIAMWVVDGITNVRMGRKNKGIQIRDG